MPWPWPWPDLDISRYVVFTVSGYATWTPYSFKEFESPCFRRIHTIMTHIKIGHSTAIHCNLLDLGMGDSCPWFWISRQIYKLWNLLMVYSYTIFTHICMSILYMTVTDALYVAYTATLYQCRKPYLTVFSGKQICLRGLLGANPSGFRYNYIPGSLSDRDNPLWP